MSLEGAVRRLAGAEWTYDEAFVDFYFDDDVSPADLITMAVIEEWVDGP